MKKIFHLYLMLGLLCLASGLSFADQTSSSSAQTNASTDAKATADQAAVPPVQVPAVDTDETKTSYLYDLKKLIDKSRENIKEVNEKIKEQAVLKRNQKREERAREYYEKGLELTNEGKLSEAREYFEKAIRITEHPEMAGYIRESQRRLRRQEAALQSQEHQHYDQIKHDADVRKEDIEEAYREAVELYKEKKYHPAKDAFEHVDELVPDYRATDSYLKIIDQDIILSDAEAAKAQAVEIERQQQEAEAARAKEKQMWLEQIAEKEKERKESIDLQAAQVYSEAVELYNQKKFAAAKKKFEEVSWVIPDYKSTMRYLSRIDHDAQVEEERVAREQQKVLEEQRWEEIVQQKKLEAARSHEMEIKKQEQQKSLEDQAQFVYTQAVSLYSQNKIDDALERFNDIEKLVPDYKSTRAYIAKIQQIEYERNPQAFANTSPATVAPVATLSSAAVEVKHEMEYKTKEKRAHELYVDAIYLYRHHQWQDARDKFLAVENEIPDYKHTSQYMLKIAEYVPNLPTQPPGLAQPSPEVVKVTPLAPVMPAQVKVAISMEAQQKQAQEIAALAEKSAELYHQIAAISDDSTMVQTKRQMAKLDDVLNNLKDTQQRALRQMQEEQWRQQQVESREKQEQARDQAENTYNQAMDLWRSHDYAKARLKFLEVEALYPNYRATRRNMERLDADIRKTNVEAVTNYEKNEAEHLKELQEKENRVVMEHIQVEQANQQQVAQQQQLSLQQLAQKASQINDDIIQLSKTQDYEGMKLRFVELQNTVTALTLLKDEMAKEKDHLAREKELADETMHEHNQALKAQEEEDRQIHAYYGAETFKEYHPVLSEQTEDVDTYKRREIMQEQNSLFSEAVDRYEHKKYTQAKLLFGELADQNDRRAEVWLKKVDRAITQQLLGSEAAEERERTAFLQDQVQAQRQLEVIQARERDRQKRLTEELERQKRLYEDQRLLDLRKEQVMKAQERERQREEAKRLEKEKAEEQKEAALHFRRVVPVVTAPVQPAVVKPAPVAVAVAAPVPAAVTLTPVVVSPPKPAGPAALTPEQLKAQEEFSRKRKEYLDRIFQEAQEKQERQAKIAAAKQAEQDRIAEREKERAQREQERQARIEALKEERQRRIEEREKLQAQHEKEEQERQEALAQARENEKEARQKEIEQQEELRAQREQAREARLKALEEAKIAAAHAAEQRAAEERQRQEELQHEQEQQREEQLKQQEIEREEQEHQQEVQRQEQQRQAELEAQREAVRKQLEDGVEQMYQSALSLYNQGQYSQAADRFKDIQDIIPGYKKSSQYMDDARQKAIAASSAPVDQPTPSVSSSDSSTPVSHDQSVSKALDLFDPNAK